MLAAVTIGVMLLVAYAYFHQGLFTAFTMCCNVLIAGLVAFNFWEPLAAAWEPHLAGTILAGFEDAICLVLLFCVALGLLRLAINHLNPTVIDYPPLFQQIGAGLLGLATGYLVCGFLVCVLQTLPWHENFMFFQGESSGKEPALRRFLPPDRVWLSLMQQAGAGTFDEYDTFELRYQRYRRYGDRRTPQKYRGELDREIRR
jgi:hypothetical protein